MLSPYDKYTRRSIKVLPFSQGRINAFQFFFDSSNEATRSPPFPRPRRRSGRSPDFHWLRQFKSVSANKKSAIPNGMTDLLELLARFELATSSLPTILEAVLPCVACRKLLDKTLAYQRLFGFACCSLLYLAVGVLCRFFTTRVGFVSVSTKDSDGTDIPF